jgi:inactivated superfamily I helicase
LRLQAGLLLPERRIGLSAHDFQQAIGAKAVWLTRSLRSDDAETVPSRWLNRIENLLNGLEKPDDASWMDHMRARGNEWLGKVEALEEPQVRAAEHQTFGCATGGIPARKIGRHRHQALDP